LELREEVSHVGSEEYLDPTCAVKLELVEFGDRVQKKKMMLHPVDPVFHSLHNPNTSFHNSLAVAVNIMALSFFYFSLWLLSPLKWIKPAIILSTRHFSIIEWLMSFVKK
jgi:hypothetical protein